MSTSNGSTLTTAGGRDGARGEKQFISDRFSAYVAKCQTADASFSLHVFSEKIGINRRYLQAILRGEQNSADTLVIKDKYYEKVRDFLEQEHKHSLPRRNAWRHFDGAQFRFIITHLHHTREESGEVTLTAPSGYGKSYAAEYFKERYRQETVLVKCSIDLQQSRVLAEVGRQLGARTCRDGVLQRRYIQEGIERLT